MLTQLDKYNYMKIELEDLPSRGIMYPEGTVIKGRFLTIQDVKFLALLNEYTATAIINEIIDRCYYMTIPFEDLLLCDRIYLAFWLRANSFMKQNGYKFGLKCSHCGGNYEEEIKLDDLPLNYLQRVPHSIRLPKSGLEIDLKLPSVKDLPIVSDDKEIEYVARMICVADPIEFVSNLNAYDYAYLVAMCKSYEAGFDMKFQFACPHCKSVNNIQVVISDDGLFGQMNIRDIINVILRVTKYVGCYIPEDTPWPELEMIQDVTNAMVKEENDEVAKQEQKAKAQASAMQSRYSTGKYSSHHH